MKKILCLHGFGQNAAIFKKKTSVIRKKLLKASWECIYIDALYKMNTFPSLDHLSSSPSSPAISKGMDGQEPVENEEEGFCWWKLNDDTGVYEGWPNTLDYLQEKIQELGPFEAIMGFSQGAICTNLLCRMDMYNRSVVQDNEDSKSKQVSDHILKDVKKVILVSGCMSRSKDHQMYMKNKEKVTAIESLHVIGTTDQIILPEWSLSMAKECYESPAIMEHDGGHYLPQQNHYCSRIIDFLTLPHVTESPAKV